MPDALKPAEPPRVIPPAAQRALDEAAARRVAPPEAAPADELGGRDGLEPTRFGDWEIKGIAVDF